MNDPKYETFQSWANANEILPAATQLATHLAPPVTKSLGELATQGENDPNELLCYRYLCRGGGLLLVGPTGIGKSSFALQAMILWGIGREFFGIKPVKPLKSLLIQAENDDGDSVEIRDGVIRGLQLKEEEARLAMGNVIVAKEDARTGVGFFMAAVRPLWQISGRIYCGSIRCWRIWARSPTRRRKSAVFYAINLNPLLGEFKCAAVVVHHTNKPPAGTDKPEWAAGDFAYLGGGSSEWANWARAVLGIAESGFSYRV
ncbi:MAG: AAA family ATPase [Verrucomicrobiota bacterium]